MSQQYTQWEDPDVSVSVLNGLELNPTMILEKERKTNCERLGLSNLLDFGDFLTVCVARTIGSACTGQGGCSKLNICSGGLIYAPIVVMNFLLKKSYYDFFVAEDPGPDAKRLKITSVESSAECTGPRASPVIISSALANFLGTGEREMQQSEVMSRVWEYIRINQMEVSSPTDNFLLFIGCQLVLICLLASLLSSICIIYIKKYCQLYLDVGSVFCATCYNFFWLSSG